jgi:hypothetical protein
MTDRSKAIEDLDEVKEYMGGGLEVNEMILDNLLAYLTVDQIKDFTEHFKRTHDIMGYEQYELCMETQTTFDSNKVHSCGDTQPPQGSNRYFSSLVPEC